MARFRLKEPEKVRGDQLVAEINAALGTRLDVLDVVLYGVDEIEVPVEGRDAQLQAVIDRHVPTATYFQHEKDAAAAKAFVWNLASLAVGKPIQTVQPPQVIALLAVLLWKEGAIGPDGKVQPLETWAVKR